MDLILHDLGTLTILIKTTPANMLINHRAKSATTLPIDIKTVPSLLTSWHHCYYFDVPCENFNKAKITKTDGDLNTLWNANPVSIFSIGEPNIRKKPIWPERNCTNQKQNRFGLTE